MIRISGSGNDGLASCQPIIVLVDHDDPDFLDIYARLREAKLPVKWLPLGLSADEYEIHATLEEATLCSSGISVSTEDIEAAPLVFYRRWRLSPPEAAIKCALEGDPNNFGQHEWAAALDYVLWSWQRCSPRTTWANPLDSVRNRLALYRLSVESGLNVPHTVISTRHHNLPPSVVAKAIGTDECIDGDSYFPTTLLQPSVVESLTKDRSPCPNLVQTTVVADRELRVLYALGEIRAVALTRADNGGPIDIRYSSDIERVRYDLPSDVATRIRQLAHLAGLNLFTIDLLVDLGGTYWVVDITPSGTVSGLDDDHETLVGCCIEGVRKELNALSV